jgi:hypothetical protein
MFAASLVPFATVWVAGTGMASVPRVRVRGCRRLRQPDISWVCLRGRTTRRESGEPARRTCPFQRHDRHLHRRDVPIVEVASRRIRRNLRPDNVRAPGSEIARHKA